MNPRTVFRLSAKDLYLLRLPLALYTLCGIAAVVLANLGDRSARALGVTLAVNIFIAACFHLVLGNVLSERQNRTLAFTMSLPVSPREVTAGKLLSCIGMYLLCGVFAAVALVALSPVDVAAVAAHDGRSFLSHALGWAAYFGLTLGGFLVLFAVVLATAIVSESLGWTIAVSTALIFVVGNSLILFGSRIQMLTAYVRELARGGPALGWTLALETCLVVAILSCTFYLQDRKQSFL